MSNLIDVSYFIGEKDIPNTIHADVSATVTRLITEREAIFLQTLMGYELSNKFTTALAIPTLDPIWLNIKNGVEFTGYNGSKKKWTGFVNTAKNSPIAEYIYYYYLKRNATQTGGVGEVTAQAQNATTASPRHKMSAAWNAMVELNKILDEYLRINYAVYPEYQIKDDERAFRSLLTRINPYGI